MTQIVMLLANFSVDRSTLQQRIINIIIIIVIIHHKKTVFQTNL